MRGGAGAGQGKHQTRFCMSVTMEMKKSIMGYSPGGPKPFLKITLATPSLVAPARGIMESGLSLGGEGMGSRAFLTYESNVLYALRFMIDKGVVGGCWVTLPKGKYCLGPNGRVGVGVLNAAAGASSSSGGHHNSRATHCQIEAHIHARDLVAHAPEGEWARLAPLRVLSFDIECAGRKVCFFFFLFFPFFLSSRGRKIRRGRGGGKSHPFFLSRRSPQQQLRNRGTSRSLPRTRSSRSLLWSR